MHCPPASLRVFASKPKLFTGVYINSSKKLTPCSFVKILVSPSQRLQSCRDEYAAVAFAAWCWCQMVGERLCGLVEAPINFIIFFRLQLVRALLHSTVGGHGLGLCNLCSLAANDGWQ
ncbi:hypothetical protein ABZP36_034424 [Zizania latifolia]